MKGWLVLVLKRHVEALHELSIEELAEMGVLQGTMAKLLHGEMECEKEYTSLKGALYVLRRGIGLCPTPFQTCIPKGNPHVHIVAKPMSFHTSLKGTLAARAAHFRSLKGTLYAEDRRRQATAP